jgi:hypothetical protein
VDPDSPEGVTAREDRVKPEAFTSGLACVSFSATTIALFYAYGDLHWRIIHDHYKTLEEPLKGKLFHLLGYLELYHATALLALCFGLRTFWTRPLCVRLACLPFMLISLVLLFSIM